MLIEPPDRFLPYDEAGQPQVPIAGYPNTVRRHPSLPLFRRPVTRTELTGPLDLAPKLWPGDTNLALSPEGRPALGQLIHVSGRVLDEDGRPVCGAIVEIWQANAAGRYFNPLDQRDAPLDPNFIGNGRAVTDAEGGYAFFTIRPGAYPVPNSGRWWRPPHVHFSILGPSSLSRLVTQMYFPGDPLNAHDRLLNALPDLAARERLVAQEVPTEEVDGEWLAYSHRMVLRGRHATPALP
ncbi:protocatechuate 3,4-dioxygenase subunit beta [Roseomonas chloroacetimidivorans]|uniref:dioxygenase family protein n=1 Tax=Roseomonas chloroacetimidivorans TaxID=1766656 RepID=UPI003C792925